MFISYAFAQTAETAAQVQQASPFSGMIMQLVLVIAIVYFFLIRPQQKRIRQHEAKLNAIIQGTQVIVSGLLGRVVSVREDNQLIVEFAPGFQVTVLRPYVSDVFFESSPKKKKKKK